jgi:hypothetical protein
VELRRVMRKRTLTLALAMTVIVPVALLGIWDAVNAVANFAFELALSRTIKEFQNPWDPPKP